MPLAPKKPCPYPGCGIAIDRLERYCDKHRKANQRRVYRDRQEDPAKREAHRFYNSIAWRNCRALQLSEHPLCCMCEAENRVVAATVVDHVTELNAGGAALDPANLQALCASCHARKTRADGHAW